MIGKSPRLRPALGRVGRNLNAILLLGLPLLAFMAVFVKLVLL